MRVTSKSDFLFLEAKKSSTGQKKQYFLITVSCTAQRVSWDNSSEGEAGGQRKCVSYYLMSCLVVCAQGRDDRQRPAVIHSAYALLTVSDTAMQKHRE